MRLARQIKQLCNAFERDGNKLLRQHDLTIAQVEILRLLAEAEARGERINQRGIEATLGLKNPTVTGTLNRLEGKGLIRRTGDPRDGRSKIIGLTEDARALRCMAEVHFGAQNARVMRGITDKERALVEDVLHRMLVNLDAVSEERNV